MLTVSVVSHEHGDEVWNLVRTLSKYNYISQIIVTLNVPEYLPDDINSIAEIINNDSPKGYGANHNYAFRSCNSDLFCVINPDIIINDETFPILLNVMKDQRIGIAGPVVLDENLKVADSMRKIVTPLSLLKRITGIDNDGQQISEELHIIFPDWIAGMFMLFRADVFSDISGFDEGFYMYCEDIDVCVRVWKSGFKVVGCARSSIIHTGSRASRKKLKFFIWHLESMLKYFFKMSVRGYNYRSNKFPLK